MVLFEWLLKKPDFRVQTSVWHTNRRNQEELSEPGESAAKAAAYG